MDEDLHKIDDLFKKALDDHDEMPSGNVWADIDKNLDKKKVLTIAGKYKKLKWVAAALLIFSVGMAMYTWNTKMKNRELVHENTANRTRRSPNDIRANRTKEIITDKDSKNNTKDKDLTSNTSTGSGSTRDSVLIKENNSLAKNGKINRTNEAKRPDNISGKVAENTSQTVAKPTVENKLSSGKIKTKTSGSLASNKVIHKGKNIFGEQTSSNSVNETLREKAIDRNNGAENLINKKPVIDIAAVREENYKLSNIPPISLSSTNAFAKNLFNNSTKVNGSAKSGKGIIKSLKKFPFSATIFYSPDFISSRVDNDHRRYREDDRDEIKDKEQIRKASSVGALISKNISKRFSLESGITFSSMTTSIRPKTIFARPDLNGNINYRFNCSAGYAFVGLPSGNSPAAGDSISSSASTNTLKYVSVPLALKYGLNKGRFSLNISSGVALNFLTSAKLETGITGSGGNAKASTNVIEGLNNNYLSGSISLGADYSLNKNLSLTFAPTARLALTPINNDTPVKTYLNSFGLAAGLSIKL